MYKHILIPRDRRSRGRCTVFARGNPRSPARIGDTVIAFAVFPASKRFEISTETRHSVKCTATQGLWAFTSPGEHRQHAR